MSKSTFLRNVFLAGAAALAIAACGKMGGEKTGPDAATTAEKPAEAAVDYAAVAAAAVADPARPEEDRAEDERRHPATALEFMQIAPGQTVFEMEAGPGWYTELLSHAVGANGKVIMQNFSGFRDYVAAKIDARLANGRLANVTESVSPFDALDAADGSVDVVTWVQGPHEIYFKPQDQSLGDPVKAYAEIFRVLKPGGVFVVIDHSAEAGAPETTGNDLHRIDKAIVVKLAEDAGFTMDGESTFLSNPEDSLTVGVFDPSIRGKTDQFAIRFKKPE